MGSKKILLIEDEQGIIDVLEFLLEENGYRSAVAMSGEEAERVMDTESFDIILLDLNLPDISGLDLFKSIQMKQRDAPVIMLTAKSEEIDKVVGLEIGADDYVTKPFSNRELMARIKAVLRRGIKRIEDTRFLEFGVIKMDREAFTVIIADTKMDLTLQEFRLLESLIKNPARVFTREMLIDRIYDGEHVITDRSIDAYIKRIRKKFQIVNAEMDPVQTVYGIGYKINADLECVS